MIEIKKDPSRKELLVFAELLAAFLAVVGLILHRAGQPGAATVLWYTAVPVAIIGGAVGYFLPRAMRPVYLAWVYAAYPIGWTVSLLILVMIYYLVLTPIGLVMRLAGYDPMERRFDRTAGTYWVPHDPGRKPSRYFRQF